MLYTCAVYVFVVYVCLLLLHLLCEINYIMQLWTSAGWGGDNTKCGHGCKKLHIFSDVVYGWPLYF